jgi:cellobiose PTS system EIIA component
MNLLLTHAEDQLMSAEAFKIIANEFIDLYKTIQSKK